MNKINNYWVCLRLTPHVRNFYGEQQISLSGLAPEIFGLEDRRLIYLATRTIELGIEIHSLQPGDGFMRTNTRIDGTD